MDIRLLLMTGGDIPIPSLTATIHQPTIREIAMIGEKDFFIGAQLLCVDKNFYIQDKNTLSQTNNFQIFMTVLSNKEEVSKKIATLQVLTLLFPKYKINLTPRALMLTEGENSIVIDENNFCTKHARPLHKPGSTIILITVKIFSLATDFSPP